MKKTLIGITLLALSTTASSSDFFGGNGGEWKMGPSGPYYDESNWPVWTPMYWMEEMMDSFDNDNSYGGNNFGGMMPNNMFSNNAPAYYPQMQAPQPGYAYQVPALPAPAAPTAPAQPAQK